MQRGTATIGSSMPSPLNVLYRYTHRVAWLGALLWAAGLPDGGLASTSGWSSGGGRLQVFQLAGPRLAPTRAG
jgi:hypothetical protein